MIIEGFDKVEVFKKALYSKDKTQILMCLEASDLREISNDIKELCKTIEDNEILLYSIKTLKKTGDIEQNLINEILSKIKNETVVYEINNII